MYWSGMEWNLVQFHSNPLQHIWIEINTCTSKQGVDTKNCPESIMDNIIMFLSSRWPESILGSSHLAHGRGKWLFGCWTSQSRLSRLPKLVKPTWPTCSNARTYFTIAFLSSSWLKNIYGSLDLESGWINYEFRKIFTWNFLRLVGLAESPYWLSRFSLFSA
jgi:hypothetical protein